jgi:hypothetical protein
MHDTALYNLLCSLICEVEESRLQTKNEIRAAAEKKITGDFTEREREILADVLLIMAQSAMCGYYRQSAEREFEALKIDGDNCGRQEKGQ